MKSAKVLGFILHNDGLKKLVMNDPRPQLIPPLGTTEDQPDRKFFEPIGKKLTLEVENTGYFFSIFSFQKDVQGILQESIPCALQVARRKILM